MLLSFIAVAAISSAWCDKGWLAGITIDSEVVRLNRTFVSFLYRCEFSLIFFCTPCLMSAHPLLMLVHCLWLVVH